MNCSVCSQDSDVSACDLLQLKLRDSKRVLALNLSNGVLRSSSIDREIQPRSDDKSRSFATLMRAVSVL